MPKQLSNAALDAYRRGGYYFPVPALRASEVAHYRGCLEAKAPLGLARTSRRSTRPGRSGPRACGFRRPGHAARR